MARAAIAIASRRVDLPDPFSPTKKVTGDVRCRPGKERMAGSSNGKPCSVPDRCRISTSCITEMVAHAHRRRLVFPETSRVNRLYASRDRDQLVLDGGWLHFSEVVRGI